MAPHIIWPMRFVLPHHKGLRPQWLLGLGLFIYDHLGGRKLLPAATRIDLKQDRAGAILQETFDTAFEYSDCWVEDSPLGYFELARCLAKRCRGHATHQVDQCRI